MIRVLLADDHAVVRAGLRALLGSMPDIAVIGEAGDGRQAIDLVRRHRPDLLLIDLTMPSLNGFDAIAQVKAMAPRTRILVVSMHGAPEFVRPAFQAGADGYVVKGQGLDGLAEAIRRVAAGERHADAQTMAILEGDELRGPGAAADELDRLTGREREVLQLVAEGKTNREIAALLDLSPKTVDTHRANVMQKLDLHSAQALTRFAIRRGLIAPE